ncbi:MAG: hypothetical protein DRJ09_07315 [Bacteroidetes bacterium]|nr:MAG: hypothetical protein DRJ09_07315 [Bacteroidota bacterium]
MSSKVAETRKKEIKEALFDIIVTDGIRHLTTKNLARRAGLSEGTLYRHFGSKNEIFQSIAYDVEEELLKDLQKIALSKQSPEKRLKLFICHHYSYLTSHRGINILLFSLASYNDDKKLLNTLSHIFHLQKKYFCKIVTDGMVKGIWDTSVSPEKLSEFYMGIPTTLNIEINLEKGKLPNDSVCLQIFLLVIKILDK